MKDIKVTERDVIGSDPFARFLKRIRIKPWQAALVSLLVFLTYVLALSAYFDVLHPRAGLSRSSIEDHTNQIGFWIIHPAVIFFYIWQAGAIARLYARVIPLAPESKISGLFRTSRMLHRNRPWWLAGFALGLLVVILGTIFIVDLMGMRWYSINVLMAVILQISRFLLLYMITTIIARHLIAAVNINRIYRHIKLPVLVAKSRYGSSFEAIASFGFAFAAFGAILGIFIAVRYLYSSPVFPEDAIYLTAYVLLVPFSFLMPFWQAHVNMLAAKEVVVNQISDALQDEYDKLLGQFKLEESLGDFSSRIKSLRDLLELTEKAPTWPFENLSIIRVMLTTILPFVLTGVGYILEILF